MAVCVQERQMPAMLAELAGNTALVPVQPVLAVVKIVMVVNADTKPAMTPGVSFSFTHLSSTPVTIGRFHKNVMSMQTNAPAASKSYAVPSQSYFFINAL